MDAAATFTDERCVFQGVIATAVLNMCLHLVSSSHTPPREFKKQRSDASILYKHGRILRAAVTVIHPHRDACKNHKRSAEMLEYAIYVRYLMKYFVEGCFQ